MICSPLPRVRDYSLRGTDLKSRSIQSSSYKLVLLEYPVCGFVGVCGGIRICSRLVWAEGTGQAAHGAQHFFRSAHGHCGKGIQGKAQCWGETSGGEATQRCD
jgi:hypothetical protein